jgi:hypothetical protein
MDRKMDFYLKLVPVLFRIFTFQITWLMDVIVSIILAEGLVAMRLFLYLFYVITAQEESVRKI